jgi:hypothetical protein
LVLDGDHGEVLWSLLDGLEYVAHTTWKHQARDKHEGCKGRSDCPHWRNVLPLARTVAANDWVEFRQRARFWLCPNSDEGVQDVPRIFLQPARRPGMPRDSSRGPGRWLDPEDLRRVPHEEPRRHVEPASDPTASGERSGDRFEREANWCRDVLPDWTPVGVHGENLLLHRPGSTNHYGATVSKRGQGILYVFTSNAAPLEPDTGYGSVWSEKVSGRSSPESGRDRPPSNPSGIEIVDEAVQHDAR